MRVAIALFAILSVFALLGQALVVSLGTANGCVLSQSGKDVVGYQTKDDACRYTLRYAQAGRWEDPVITTNTTGQPSDSLPPSCPQTPGSIVAGHAQSEDCLFATIYVPHGKAPSGGWSTFVWIHGGSFIEGGIAAPGLDGSKLATGGNVIVILIQYRLGVLGLLPPALSSTAADPNLALKDVIVALKAIHKYISQIGGNKRKITVGGQSTGATIIRALLGVPKATGLFRGAILHSDPMTYGFASQNITEQIQAAFFSKKPWSNCSTLDCMKAISLPTLITAQDTLFNTVIYDIGGIPASQPVRPTFHTDTLPQDPTDQLFNNPSSLTYPPSSIPLLLTTTKNEGGSAVGSIFSAPVTLSNDTYYAIAAKLNGAGRAAAIINSPYYALPPANHSSMDYGPSGDTFREVFEKAVTQGVWTCPNRDVAQSWQQSGGHVWVGEWTQGITYPENELISYCHKSGIVCHQDDIYATFGTAPSSTVNVSSLVSSPPIQPR
ncbi:uncharacterized protein L203_105971 [Cryptococcus depauperatus CBS 7841]|uniref:Carboxylesterase type B domain-containing protein n=1 Tax=Cryptococcus depauperatus CBS 7841 TaxID=1295531 RepID=A0AAJ8JYM7_9TREE